MSMQLEELPLLHNPRCLMVNTIVGCVSVAAMKGPCVLMSMKL
jgi:hypothetical protein